MQVNDPHATRLYMLGLICLSLGLILFVICLYIMPVAFFGWSYHLPLRLDEFIVWLQEQHGIQGYAEVALLLLPPLVVAFALIGLARFCTYQIESDTKRADEQAATQLAVWAAQRPSAIRSKGFIDAHPLAAVLLAIAVSAILLVIFELLLVYNLMP